MHNYARGTGEPPRELDEPELRSRRMAILGSAARVCLISSSSTFTYAISAVRMSNNGTRMRSPMIHGVSAGQLPLGGGAGGVKASMWHARQRSARGLRVGPTSAGFSGLRLRERRNPATPTAQLVR